MLVSYVLPLYAAWFWFSWYAHDRHGSPVWRRLIGAVAAALATAAIFWRYLFPIILYEHALQAGGEDQLWWRISLWSIRIGVWLSAAGLLLAALGLGTRVYPAASSAIMGTTYFVLFAIR